MHPLKFQMLAKTDSRLPSLPVRLSLTDKLPAIDFTVNFWEPFCFPCALYVTTSVQRHQDCKFLIIFPFARLLQGTVLILIYSCIHSSNSQTFSGFMCRWLWEGRQFCIQVRHKAFGFWHTWIQILASPPFDGWSRKLDFGYWELYLFYMVVELKYCILNIQESIGNLVSAQ